VQLALEGVGTLVFLAVVSGRVLVGMGRMREAEEHWVVVELGR
jgi:hypothetical protein